MLVDEMIHINACAGLLGAGAGCWVLGDHYIDIVFKTCTVCDTQGQS